MTPRQVARGLVLPYADAEAYSQVYDLAAPAAGSNASLTVDGRWWMRVLAARATLTTDANAANRFFSLDFINARGITYVRNAAGVVIPASQSNQAFEWNAFRTVAEWATNTPFLLPLAPIFLEPGFSVQFTVDSIQATDALTGMRLLVEQFPTGPRGEPKGVVDQRQEVPIFVTT